jgi:hypothetical protein
MGSGKNTSVCRYVTRRPQQKHLWQDNKRSFGGVQKITSSAATQFRRRRLVGCLKAFKSNVAAQKKKHSLAIVGARAVQRWAERWVAAALRAWRDAGLAAKARQAEAERLRTKRLQRILRLSFIAW